jgi:hypothetical protein
MFCAPIFVLCRTEGVGSRFHILRSRTLFQRYRGRRVQFLFFCFRTCFRWYRRCRVSFSLFRRYRRCQVPFSCIALPDLFGSVQRSSGPIFIFCDLGLAFDGTEGAGPRFHVLRSKNRLGLYQGRRVPFSSFELPDTFFAVSRASCPIFMFCTSGLIFGRTEGVESRIHVLRSRSHFGRYRGCRVQFSCFALPDSFGAVPSSSGPVFMFCAVGIIFGDIEGEGSRFCVLRSHIHFRRYRGRWVSIVCFALSDSFSADRRHQVLFSSFVLRDSFSTVPMASGPGFFFFLPNSFLAVPRVLGPVFMFCAPELFLGGFEGAGSRFHDLRYRNRLGMYQGRWVPFLSFALPDTF